MRKADPEKIGWVDWVANPIRCRCRHGCEYCYMTPMYRRFPGKWPEEAGWHGPELSGMRNKKSRRIWFGSSTDMFGAWVGSDLIATLLKECRKYPQHTYYFLTKNPKRYAEFDFPANCWLGVTLEDSSESVRERAMDHRHVTSKRHQSFASCEPLLGPVTKALAITSPDWVILGAMSGPGAVRPDREWVDDALRWWGPTDPVYIKHNLAVLYPDAEWSQKRERP